MRVLYGYRWNGRQAVVDPVAAAVVAAVLAFELGHGETVARWVLRVAGQPLPAVRQLVQRIRSHRHNYLEGVPHATLAPDRRLKIAGAAPLARYCAGASGEVVSPGFQNADVQVARPGHRRLITLPKTRKHRKQCHVRKTKTSRTIPSNIGGQARR